MDTITTFQPVQLLPVEKKVKGDLCDEIYYECAFCGKKEAVSGEHRTICERLSGDNFYCSFCLRNQFHTKNNRNVFICSFRAIIGFYYYNFYKFPPTFCNHIYISELQDYIAAHVNAGLANPVFSYDPTTYLWFIDFSRVGRGRKKVKLKEVLHTVSNILTCFNLAQHIPKLDIPFFYGKFEDSLLKFQATRYRPENHYYCIPTFANCIDGYLSKKTFTFEDTRWFTPDQIEFA